MMRPIIDAPELNFGAKLKLKLSTGNARNFRLCCSFGTGLLGRQKVGRSEQLVSRGSSSADNLRPANGAQLSERKGGWKKAVLG